MKLKSCDKRQYCSICDGMFKMTRGCNLEKRCPACRFLKIQNRHEDIIFVPWEAKCQFKVVKDKTHEQMGLTQDKYKQIEKLEFRLFPLNADDITLYSKEPSSLSILLREDLNREIDKMMTRLNEREVYVIRLRFGLNSSNSCMELVKIAKDLKITTERVRQIELMAIKKLHHPKTSGGLKQYIYQ